MNTSKRKDTSQTRKETIMTISRKEALTIARDARKETNAPVADVIQKMIDQLSKPLTDDQRQARNAKIRAINAARRKAEMEQVLPVLREGFSHYEMPITAQTL